MTLAVSIAERIGAVPKRTLVVGGFPNFVERTFRRKAAAWGLLIEWHWQMGERRREVRIPAGCEVVVYFSDMVDVPATWGPALKAAVGPGVLLIHTVRKAAIWQQDFSRAGLRQDHLYQLKEPEMPPAPPVQPKPSISLPPPRTYTTIIAEMVSLLGELEEVLDKDTKSRASAEELLARATEAIHRAEVAEGKLKALDALREFLKQS